MILRKGFFVWLSGGIVLAAAFLTLFNLGVRPLQDYDEAQYAIVTREMVRSGDWLQPTFLGKPYFEKPPLYFWLAAFSIEAFGESEFSLRLPSALAGIGAVVAVMLLACELAIVREAPGGGGGAARSFAAGAAIIAGAAAVTTAPLIETAREIRVDTLVTFFIVLAAWAFARGMRDPRPFGAPRSRWYWIFGAAAGFAVLAKSVIAIFAFAAALSLALWLVPGPLARRLGFLRDARFWQGIVIFVLVAVPWHLYELIRYGGSFWRVYVEFNLFNRTAENLFPVSVTNGGYVWYLTHFAVPWTQAFAAACVVMIALWRVLDSRAMRAAAACVSVVAAVIAVFFTAATKAPTYLVPLYPFAEVSIGLVGAALIERWGRSAIGGAIAGAAIMLLAATGMRSAVYNGFHFTPYYAATDALSREELSIGAILRADGAGRTLFAYGHPPLGSIMYYSGDERPLALAGPPPKAGSYIVVEPAAHAALAARYPTLSTRTQFEGKRLLLLQVLSED